MSDSQKKSGWFLLNNYGAQSTPDATKEHEPTNITEESKLATQLESLDSNLAALYERLNNKFDDLEHALVTKMDESLVNSSNWYDILDTKINTLDKKMRDLDTKLDKLIESNKSLLAYFSAMHDRDTRELNLAIRKHSTKNHKVEPIKFVPEHS